MAKKKKDVTTLSKIRTGDVLRRMGLLQPSANALGRQLGRYVYAYYDPNDWRKLIASPSYADRYRNGKPRQDIAPIPFYIGIGINGRFANHIDEALKGKPGAKRDKIREILTRGDVPDIRFLSYKMPRDANASISGEDLSRHIETVLLNMFGPEGNRPMSDEPGPDEEAGFNDRMGFPSILTNRASSSTAIHSGSLASTSALISGDNITPGNFFDMAELSNTLIEKYDVDDVRYFDISKGYDTKANIDQLKVITCEWWVRRKFIQEDSEGSLRGERKFIIIGYARNPKYQWEVQHSDIEISSSIPLIRSAFIVDSGALDYTSSGHRVSVTRRSRFDENLWREVVGRYINRTTNQLQGQPWHSSGKECLGDISSIEEV